MTLNYEKSIELLTSNARFRIELGLERIEKILELLGNPQNDFKIIHIAGTNGKGSVCAITAKILECAGFKTALYTSPHLVDYTERIKINFQDISKQDFARLLTLVINTADKNKIELTEFEILTAAAFKYFSEEHVDYAIVETGLGGRFDATNIDAKNKILSVITSISIDHKNILGDTIEKIAFEKAGIIKKGIHTIVSKENKGFNVIKEQTEKLNSPLLIPKDEVKLEFDGKKNYAVFRGEKYEFALLGLFQKENLELVFEICKYLKIEKSAIEKGLKSVVWHSRFQFIKDKNLIIDGAHNEGAAKVLRESLDFYFPVQNRTFIFGAMNTKEYQKVAKILFSPKDTVYFYQFKDNRAISFEEFKTCCPIAKEVSLEYIKNKVFKKTLKQVQSDKPVQNNEIIVTCGSFYITGEIIRLIQKNKEL